jgi:hypothetical protein
MKGGGNQYKEKDTDKTNKESQTKTRKEVQLFFKSTVLSLLPSLISFLYEEESKSFPKKRGKKGKELNTDLSEWYQ